MAKYLYTLIIVITGIPLNAVILWVLKNVRRSPLDYFQINVCFANIVDGILGSAFVIASRIVFIEDHKTALSLFVFNLVLYVTNVTFDCLTSIVLTIVRMLQICSLTKRAALTTKTCSCSLIVAAWLAAAAAPLCVAAGSLKMFYEEDASDWSTTVLLPMRVQVISVVMATSFVLVFCTVVTVRFMKRHEKNVLIHDMRTTHLRKAMNTVIIAFALSCCCLVSSFFQIYSI